MAYLSRALSPFLTLSYFQALDFTFFRSLYLSSPFLPLAPPPNDLMTTRISMRSLPSLASISTASSDPRFHFKWRAITVVAILALGLLLYLHQTAGGTTEETQFFPSLRQRDGGRRLIRDVIAKTEAQYNHTYPLSPPERTAYGVRYRIAVIADLDTNSRSTKDNTWFSYMQRGHLLVSDNGEHMEVEWDPDKVVLESHLSEKGRGMELSDLVAFDGHLYSVDDRTGVVYRIAGNRAVPWVILPDGDGNVSKGERKAIGELKFRIIRHPIFILPAAVFYTNFQVVSVFCGKNEKGNDFL